MAAVTLTFALLPSKSNHFIHESERTFEQTLKEILSSILVMLRSQDWLVTDGPTDVDIRQTGQTQRHNTPSPVCHWPIKDK